MRIITKITSILLIFVFLATTPAVVLGSQGQLLQAEPSKVAMQAIGLAKHYYAQGKFEKAAELFMEAHKLDSRVEFMFNAARAYQRAIQLSKAKDLFNRCVKTKGASAVVIQKASIYLREIQNMERALSKAKNEGKKRVVVVKPKPKPKKRVVVKKSTWKQTSGAISLAGAALAGIAGGWLLITSYELSKNADNKAADLDIGFDEYQQDKDKAEMYNVLGWSLSGVAIAGAVFGFWGLSSDNSKVSLAPTGNGATLMVRF
jgi:tetratricopeptide (TPR) repeat protein